MVVLFYNQVLDVRTVKIKLFHSKMSLFLWSGSNYKGVITDLKTFSLRLGHMSFEHPTKNMHYFRLLGPSFEYLTETGINSDFGNTPIIWISNRIRH